MSYGAMESSDHCQGQPGSTSTPFGVNESHKFRYNAQAFCCYPRPLIKRTPMMPSVSDDRPPGMFEHSCSSSGAVVRLRLQPLTDMLWRGKGNHSPQSRPLFHTGRLLNLYKRLGIKRTSSPRISRFNTVSKPIPRFRRSHSHRLLRTHSSQHASPHTLHRALPHCHCLGSASNLLCRM